MIGVDDLKWWGLKLLKILTIRKVFSCYIWSGFIFVRFATWLLSLQGNSLLYGMYDETVLIRCIILQFSFACETWPDSSISWPDSPRSHLGLGSAGEPWVRPFLHASDTSIPLKPVSSSRSIAFNELIRLFIWRI